MQVFNDEQKKITAARLKELRNKRNLSHEKLHDELEKANIKVSVQSLKDYEVIDVNHTKFRATKGMSIETLYGLAEFYNVSADYLLGRSDIDSRNADEAKAREYTGFSAKAMNTVIRNKNIINDFLELDSTAAFFVCLNDWQIISAKYNCFKNVTVKYRYDKFDDDSTINDILNHAFFAYMPVKILENSDTLELVVECKGNLETEKNSCGFVLQQNFFSLIGELSNVSKFNNYFINHLISSAKDTLCKNLKGCNKLLEELQDKGIDDSYIQDEIIELNEIIDEIQKEASENGSNNQTDK